MKKAAVCLVVLSVSACGVSQQDARNLNYGPSPKNYAAEVVSLLKSELKNPDSVQIKSITKPRRGYASYGFGTKEYGWHVDVTYNAKNSYGGYTGYETRQYIYNGGYSIPHTYEITFIDNKEYYCNNNCSEK